MSTALRPITPARPFVGAEGVTIAGRCPCGVILAWATGDEHLDCRGQKRCTECREVRARREFVVGRGRCASCRRRWRAAYMRMRRADPAYRAKQNESSKLYQERQRRLGTAVYERSKADRRRRTREDPVFAERERARVRARYRRLKRAAA